MQTSKMIWYERNLHPTRSSTQMIGFQNSEIKDLWPVDFALHPLLDLLQQPSSQLVFFQKAILKHYEPQS